MSAFRSARGRIVEGAKSGSKVTVTPSRGKVVPVQLSFEPEAIFPDALVRSLIDEWLVPTLVERFLIGTISGDQLAT
jgi:hypothetical protein